MFYRRRFKAPHLFSKHKWAIFSTGSKWLFNVREVYHGDEPAAKCAVFRFINFQVIVLVV